VIRRDWRIQPHPAGHELTLMSIYFTQYSILQIEGQKDKTTVVMVRRDRTIQKPLGGLERIFYMDLI
jgi:hypothetical protein